MVSNFEHRSYPKMSVKRPLARQDKTRQDKTKQESVTINYNSIEKLQQTNTTQHIHDKQITDTQ